MHQARSSGCDRGWSMIDQFTWQHVSRTSHRASIGKYRGTREDSMNPKETSGSSLSALTSWKRPSHGSWSCLGHKRSTKRAGVKVKGPTIAAECYRIMNEIHEYVSRESTRRVASATPITFGFCRLPHNSPSSKKIYI